MTKAQLTQILFIHGGMTFKSKKDYIDFLKNRPVKMGTKNYWSADYLTKALGKQFEISRPKMPLSENAKYNDWRIHFERFVPLLKNNCILIGSSLGGIFLAKYLSEHKFPRKLLSVYLVCPPFDNSLPGEDLVGGFKLKADLSKLDNSAKNVYLLFSKDDDVVPTKHAEKYAAKLKKAKIAILKNKNGHFGITKFSEIVKMIKRDVKRK